MSAAARAMAAKKKQKAKMKLKSQQNGADRLQAATDFVEGVETVPVEAPKPLRFRKNPENYKDTPWKHDWILMSQKVEKFTMGDDFSAFIIVVIIVAGILVGIQMYDGMDQELWVNMLDNIILGIFTIECLLKMGSEGMEPWRYWVGPEWRWNNFDFIIVVMCYPGISDAFGGGSVALLRLMRLMRIMKLVRQIPQLQMIVMGMVGGFKSIGYIMLLMFLIMYLFGIGGMMAFGKNDPWHWHNLGTALNTLFRMATLEDWTDIMYINIYGCHSEWFDSGAYTMDEREADGVSLFLCTTKEGEEPGLAITAIYMMIYILLSALVVLSLVIGAINMSMSDSLQEMKDMTMRNKHKKRMLAAKKKLRKESMPPTIWSKLKDVYVDFTGGNPSEDDANIAQLLLRTAWQGTCDQLRLEQKTEAVAKAGNGSSTVAPDLPESGSPQQKRKLSLKTILASQKVPKTGYSRLAELNKELAEDWRFQLTITLTIILAGIMVGVQTYKETYENNKDLLDAIDLIILLIFILEIVVKTVAEDKRPWMYFFVKGKLNKWNTFDFVIVVGSLMPAGGSLVTMLRLLRLLRVLKLLKALPGLQVIVMALVSGLGSIGYIGVIMVIFFYVWAILGMMLFKKNDPWHFGTLHDAMISLFRGTTGDDWTDIMYINMFGCEKYGYGGIESLCEDPSPNEFMGFFYMFVLIIIGSFVLLPLFIGVVVSGMEEAVDEQKMEQAGMRRLKRFQKRFPDCDKERISLYQAVFDIVDIDGGGSIDVEEFAVALKNAGIKVSMVKLRKLMGSCFHDGNYNPGDGIDFSRFVRLMYHAGWHNARNVGKKRKKKKKARDKKNNGKKASTIPKKKIIPTSKAAIAPANDLETGAAIPKSKEGKYETKV